MILIKNWNEQSKSAKTPKELVEIDTFYRTYIMPDEKLWKG